MSMSIIFYVHLLVYAHVHVNDPCSMFDALARAHLCMDTLVTAVKVEHFLDKNAESNSTEFSGIEIQSG